MNGHSAKTLVILLLLAAVSFGPAELMAQRFKVQEVADILPGPDSSAPGHFTRMGNELVFTARGGTLLSVRWALFKTDGQTVDRLGEVQFNSGVVPFAELKGEFFFNGIGPNGGELYKTDGERVVEVADINPGSAHSNSSDFTRLGGLRLVALW